MAVRTSQQLQQLFQKSKEEKEKKALELQELKKLKKKESAKKYRETHREEIRLAGAIYRAQNQKKLKEYQLKYRETHKDIAKEYQEQYRKKQKDLLKPTDEETISQPPVRTKKQVKELCQQWLNNLKKKEPYLEGFKLYCNQLMQKSLENELFMGRRKLITTEEEKQIKSPMQKVEEKALTLIANATTNEERKRIEEQLYYAKLRYKYSYL